MVSKAKKAFSLLIYYLSPIIASIIYWFEEPEPFSLDSSDLLIHRAGSILGIFSFIWMCFNVIVMIKIKLIETNFSADWILKFHTYMAAIALLLGIVHYPLVRWGVEYTTLQTRSGSIGFVIFVSLMVVALFFMTNRLLKYKKIEKLRTFAFALRFKYNINKALHNILMLGVFVIFIHTLVSFTSSSSLLMNGVYFFFFGITFIGWVYHKFFRRFHTESDPYSYRKVSWDIPIPKIIQERNSGWAFNLIKRNPSIYPCLQCGLCTTDCPVSEATKGDYNPRRNILASLLGYKALLLGGEELQIWGCTVCDTCDEVCPQDIELTEIFAYLKNQSIAQGKGPDSIYKQAKTIFENAKAIESQPAIERRREQLGLPQVIEPNVSDIQTLLRNLGIDKKLKLRLHPKENN